MDNLVKLGILMVIMALAIFYISSASFQGGFSSDNIQEVIVASNTARYMSFTLSNFTVVGLLYYTNGTNINFYLVNQSVFDESYSNSTGQIISNSTALQQNGAIEIIYNRSGGIFPYQQQNLSAVNIYEQTESPILPAGRYYGIFQDPTGSNTTVFYSLLSESKGAVQSKILSSAVYGLSGAGLLLAGIVLVIYSIFIRKGQKKEETVERNVESIYDRQVRAKKPARRARRRRRG